MLLPQQKMLPSPRATWVDKRRSRWLDEIIAWSNLNWPDVQTSDWYFPVNFIHLWTWERVGNWETVTLYSHQIYKTLGEENKNSRWVLFSISQANSVQKLTVNIGYAAHSRTAAKAHAPGWNQSGNLLFYTSKTNTGGWTGLKTVLGSIKNSTKQDIQPSAKGIMETLDMLQATFPNQARAL